MSEAYESSRPPSRPMPMTANGTDGSSGCSAASTQASASAASSRPVISIGARPRMSRAAMRSSSRRLNRRSPARRCSMSARHCRVSIAASTSSPRERSRTRSSSSARTSTKSGWWSSASPMMRLDPRTRHDRSAAPGESRKVVASVAPRGRRLDERAQLQQPEVGIGRRRQPVEDDGEELLHDARRAARTRSSARATRRASCPASAKPNAASRSSATSGVRRADARERVEHRREEEALVDRPDRRLVRAVVRVEGVERGPVRRGRGIRGRAPGGRARRGSVGSVCVCCSSRSWRRCSTVRRNDVGLGETARVRRTRRSRRPRAARGRRASWRSGSTRRGGRGRAAGAGPRTRCRGSRPARA